MNQKENLKRAKDKLLESHLNNNEVSATLRNDKDKLLEHILFSTTIEENFKNQSNEIKNQDWYKNRIRDRNIDKKEYIKKYGDLNFYNDCNPNCYANRFLQELEGKSFDFILSVIEDLKTGLELTPIPLND